MHIEQQTIIEFCNGTLDSKQTIEILEHMSTCDFCAEQLASLEGKQLLQAPSYLKDTIMSRIQLPDVQRNQKAKRISEKTEWLFYSLKTLSGVACAVLLLFSVTRMKLPQTITYESKTPIADVMTERLAKGSNDMVDSINRFSNRLLQGGNKQ